MTRLRWRGGLGTYSEASAGGAPSLRRYECTPWICRVGLATAQSGRFVREEEEESRKGEGGDTRADGYNRVSHRGGRKQECHVRRGTGHGRSKRKKV